MEPETYPLFVYGTLLDPQVQQLVFGRRLQGRPDRLPGFEKRERSVSGRYPEVCPDPAGKGFVEGQCLEVDAADLNRADAYETTLYHRVLVRLASGCQAWVYQASPPKSKAS